jgi:hypothetical protein
MPKGAEEEKSDIWAGGWAERGRWGGGGGCAGGLGPGIAPLDGATDEYRPPSSGL